MLIRKKITEHCLADPTAAYELLNAAPGHGNEGGVVSFQVCCASVALSKISCHICRIYNSQRASE
jgi:hypothetical protein